MKKKTKNDFIIKAKEIHGKKYDYSLVDYVNNLTKVKIICPIHGVFEQLPINHLYNEQGCPDCSNNRKMDKEKFITKAREIHGNKYDYSNVKYINAITPVEIICKIHGVFRQTPNNHISKKHKCPECKISKQLDNDEFIKRSSQIHNNFYDYSLVDYVNCLKKVIIICPIHGKFDQRPYNHTKGIGCPYCNESKGEKFIVTYLNNNDIKFSRQKKFDNCVNKKKLPFDFYLDDYNVCIEYDGIQHEQKVQKFGGYDNFIYTQKNDKIKTDFCNKNDIPLLRIKYKDIKKINELIYAFLQQIHK